MSNKALRLIRSQINSLESTTFVERDFFNVNLSTITAVFPGEKNLDEVAFGETLPPYNTEYLINHFMK